MRPSILLILFLSIAIATHSLKIEAPNPRKKYVPSLIQKQSHRTVLLTGATVLLVSCLSGAPSVGFCADVGNGKRLFEDNCAKCHTGGGGNAFAPERTLSKEALVKYNIGLDVDSVAQFIRNVELHRGVFSFQKLMKGLWHSLTFS